MIERRFSSGRPKVVSASPTRAAGGQKGSSVIVGYAATFNRQAMIGPFFREQLAPGAFTDAVGHDVRALFNHDANRLLGRSAARTLRLSQDAKGLRYEIDINPDDPLAASVASQIQRGDVDGSSFAFIVDPEDERWTYEKGKVEPLRTIYRVTTLIDICPVVFPAYSGTSVYLRSASREPIARAV